MENGDNFLGFEEFWQVMVRVRGWMEMDFEVLVVKDFV